MCYKTVESLTNAVKPRLLTSKWQEPKVKREELRAKPKKDPNPDMGSYESSKCLSYIEKKGFSQQWDKGPVLKFYESAVKHSKKVPACSHYNVPTDALNKLSKSPPSIRTRRH